MDHNGPGDRGNVVRALENYLYELMYCRHQPVKYQIMLKFDDCFTNDLHTMFQYETIEKNLLHCYSANEIDAINMHKRLVL